jgi:regulatory protein
MGKTKKPLTADYLESAAFYYLSCYASSAGNLRRVLKNKAKKRLAPGEESPAEAERWIADVVAKCLRLGLVDDKAYGAAKIGSMLRSGKSLHRIRAFLASKLLDGDLIDRLLAEAAGPDGAIELKAAMIFAKRRRFGPFAKPRDEAEDERRVRREKALGAFSRAGFPFPLAKLVLDSPSVAELEALLEEVADHSP